MTPNSRHNGETDKIISKRKEVYETARKLNPSRFNKGIRDWDPPKQGALNPTDEVKEMLKTQVC